MNIGHKLKEARTSKGLTVTALAERSGLTKGFISQVESGRSNPSLSSLRRMASALGISPDALLGPAGPHSALEVRSPALVQSEAAGYVLGIVPLLETTSGSYLISRLPANAALVSQGALGIAPAEGFCMVLDGEVTFVCGEDRRLLEQGSALAWNAAEPYRLENSGDRQARMIMRIEGGVPLPALSGARTRSAEWQPRITPNDADGPLRLVALRARRRASAEG